MRGGAVIVVATNTKHLQDATYPLILDQANVLPGQKVFIPDKAMADKVMKPPPLPVSLAPNFASAKVRESIL